MIIPNWPAPKQIKAVSSTRIGGVSQGVYRGLNVGTHVGDQNSVVERNRVIAAHQANMPTPPIWLNQTHSTDIIRVSEPTNFVLDADGLVTSNKNVVLSAMTADCLPVLLTDVEGSQVAAVHAGWRGLADGIVENALLAFDKPVMAWLGPAIGARVFEVGDDVLAAFAKFDTNAVKAFTPLSSGKWLADMSLLATQRLNKAGVELVYNANLCTYSESTRFYSYRRDGITGRQCSFIWIE